MTYAVERAPTLQMKAVIENGVHKYKKNITHLLLMVKSICSAKTCAIEFKNTRKRFYIINSPSFGYWSHFETVDEI